MPWKTEIDRLVHHLVLDAAQGSAADIRRAARTVADLTALAPEREATHFHAGTLQEIVEAGHEPEEAVALLEDLPPAGAENQSRWRYIGRLDGASRRGPRERVRALMEDPLFESSLDHPEGRVALRAVGRLLLRSGEEERAFGLYARHLGAVEEEGSRRDAEFLLEESLRRVDRSDVSAEDALARLERAGAFAESAGLDARARSKVDRKLGRMHQLAGRGEEATTCYRRALERLPEEDPYRSVLVGDLALATLGVRGTLDLLPSAERDKREEAEEILRSGQGGEGRSYNAIYTMGMLAYERGDWAAAAEHLGEADRLMRENRAKARIVHARARFFHAHCLLEQGAEGDALAEAERSIVRNASAVSLEPEVKGSVFDALVERKPDARVPGRPAPRAETSRPAASEHLAEARERLAEDPHATLDLVDRAFKSRPDFDTWFGAYRTRLDALLALDERDEALRTYERFRAKLYQRDAHDRLEAFLADEAGPVAKLLDDVALRQERIDLYDAMPDKTARFAEECAACAKADLDSGEPLRLVRAVALFQEAAAHAPDLVGDQAERATEAAKAAGALDLDVDKEELRSLLKEEEDPVRLVVVGGDKGRQRHVDAFQTLAADLGFEGEWIFTGVRPPYKTLREIAGAAQDADVILVHHALGQDMRREVKSLGEKYDVPVREAAWLGTVGVEPEVLLSLKEAFVE